MDRIFNSDSISSDFLFKFFPSFSKLFLRSIVDCCIISEFKISFLLGSQLFSDHFYITILLFNLFINGDSFLHSIWKFSLELRGFLLEHRLNRAIVFWINIKTHVPFAVKPHNISSPEHINITWIILSIVGLT